MFMLTRTRGLRRVALCCGWVVLILPAIGLTTDQERVASFVQTGHAVSVSSTQRVDPATLQAAQRGSFDSDGDGLPNFADNCRDIANANQHDSNSDGYGNACDPDLDNSGLVNFVDLQAMQIAFFSNPASPTGIRMLISTATQ